MGQAETADQPDLGHGRGKWPGAGAGRALVAAGPVGRGPSGAGCFRRLGRRPTGAAADAARPTQPGAAVPRTTRTAVAGAGGLASVDPFGAAVARRRAGAGAGARPATRAPVPWRAAPRKRFAEFPALHRARGQPALPGDAPMASADV